MAQSLSNILVHLVFSTKNRVELISPDIEGELHPYLATTCRTLGCPTLEVGGTKDHVHILFRLARTVTIADFVEQVKKGSSKWMKTKGPRFAHFFWQSGYGAFSIGASGISRVRRYIAEQKKHHERRSFQDEFRALLDRYQIEYDERYVWD